MLKIRNMGYVSSLLILLISFNTQILFAVSDLEASIKINDLQMTMYDEYGGELSALIREGRTMAPIRNIFDKFKLELIWNSDDNSITTKTPDAKVVWMQLDNKVAIVDGVNYPMDIGPTMINNKTYVPVKYIFDLLNVDYSWDEENMQVNVSSPELLEVVLSDSLSSNYKDAMMVSEGFYVIKNKNDSKKIVLVEVSELDYESEIEKSAIKIGDLVSNFTSVSSTNYKYDYFNIEGIYTTLVLEKDGKVYSMEFENITFDEVEDFIKKY